nr:MAG TPA: hypothetical protein [Caudoviricetes sp.]
MKATDQQGRSILLVKNIEVFGGRLFLVQYYGLPVIP